MTEATIPEATVTTDVSARWRITEATAFVVSGPERAVVFNLDRPKVQPLALLGTGATIWQALIGEEDDLRPWHDERELIADLAEAYGVDGDQIAPDVTAFLQQMAGGGYVESEPTQRPEA